MVKEAVYADCMRISTTSCKSGRYRTHFVSPAFWIVPSIARRACFSATASERVDPPYETAGGRPSPFYRLPFSFQMPSTAPYLRIGAITLRWTEDKEDSVKQSVGATWQEVVLLNSRAGSFAIEATWKSPSGSHSGSAVH